MLLQHKYYCHWSVFQAVELCSQCYTKGADEGFCAGNVYVNAP